MKQLISFIISVFLAGYLFAKPVMVPLENLPVYKGSYALLIGVSGYKKGFQKIYGVREDISAIENILQLYNFKTFVVMDPDHKKLRQAMDGFVEKFGMDPGNRLIIYYSGHGKQLFKDEDKDGKQEAEHYLVPVNAPNPAIDRIGFLKNAMHFDRLLHYSRTIRSKHVLFILDSCFSGGIFKVKKDGAPQNIGENAKKAVRQFITAGRHDETVPDDGSFRNGFIAALQSKGDLNGDTYLTGSEIGQYIQNTVSSPDQKPQYGKISGDDSTTGEFIIALDPEIDKSYTDMILEYKKDTEMVDSGFPYKIAAATLIGISVYGMKTNYDKVQSLTDENRKLEQEYEAALSMTEKEVILKKYRENEDEVTDTNSAFQLFGWALAAAVAWESYLVLIPPEKRPKDDAWKLVFMPPANQREARLTFQYSFK